MTDKIFQAKEAAQILQNAGLLVDLLGPEQGLLVSCKTNFMQTIAGGFAGAGLDSRHLKSGQLFVALAGEKVDGRKFIPQVLEQGHWVLAAPSPSLVADMESIQVEHEDCGLILSDNPEAALAVLGSAWRRKQNIKVVGITGTNGKTTTKDFLAAILNARGETLATAGNFNNHLGLPITLLNILPGHQFAVVEMGASAEGEIQFLAGLAGPDIGIITNASEAHLAEFGSLAGIIRGKGELLDQLPTSGLAVLNADSPGFTAWRDRAPCPVSSFGQSGGQYPWSMESCSDSQSEVIVGKAKFPVPLPGLHNGANMVAAVLVARHLGLSDQEIHSGLADFQGSPHRGVMLTLGGRQILDDCYNANPRSMLAAVTTLLQQGPGHEQMAILGHMAELGDNTASIHRETGKSIAALGLTNLLVVGPEAKPVLDGFDPTGKTGHYFPTLETAADFAAENTSMGDTILIKGSRSAAMENILPLLENLLDRK